MKAQTILDAILAMDAAYRLDFLTPPEKFARVMVELRVAQNKLAIELGNIGIEIEPVEKEVKVPS